ncbi:MAG TPA: DUF4135 domain-containing protein, partial [Vicinamibacterales bacterium]|nr:DUF4135 domain-containing protein [Vicinamibacterales bacterium]
MHTSISARARTIYERVESLRGRRFPPIDRIDDKAIAALSAWARAFAPGNPDALAARLAWDGLTPALVVAALDAPADEVAPAWTAWLDAFADAARMQAAALRTSKVETFDVAYGEIWSAVVCAAHARIDPKLPALDRQLMRELSALGDLAIDEAFSRYLEGVGIDRRTLTADSSAHYRAFVLSALDGGLMDLWHAYPVLAHQTAIVAGGWIDATTELLQRVDADRSRIGDVLNGGVDPGPIVDVEPGLSDAHDGRRRVAVLHFANGLRVVYKPRDVEIERAFGTLADWLRACGFDPFIRVSRVVSGNGYGWVEYAAHEAFDHASEAREYFRCAGALIFFTHLLGSRDLHMENVVATRSGPVVVDLELLLQPELRGAAEGDADQSCLRTGLLSLIEVGPGDEVFDVGGLRGSGRVPLAAARRTWRNGGTDAIAYVDETVAHAAVKNTV